MQVVMEVADEKGHHLLYLSHSFLSNFRKSSKVTCQKMLACENGTVFNIWCQLMLTMKILAGDCDRGAVFPSDVHHLENLFRPAQMELSIFLADEQWTADLKNKSTNEWNETNMFLWQLDKLIIELIQLVIELRQKPEKLATLWSPDFSRYDEFTIKRYYLWGFDCRTDHLSGVLTRVVILWDFGLRVRPVQWAVMRLQLEAKAGFAMFRNHRTVIRQLLVLGG